MINGVNGIQRELTLKKRKQLKIMTDLKYLVHVAIMSDDGYKQPRTAQVAAPKIKLKPARRSISWISWININVTLDQRRNRCSCSSLW